MGRNSPSLPAFAAASHFAINVLAESQELTATKARIEERLAA